ncbi:MAG: clostripain-related cysteine peptidase, partial [Anaerolineaceae bacterium]
DRYALILSDHGMGWPGGWTDAGSRGADTGSAPLVQMIGEDSIFLNELDDNLARIQAATGIEKLDLIGMDACLMSQIEVYTALQPYARFAVASEETEPALGWAYAAFFEQLNNNPGMDGAQLAAAIVDTYIAQDQRVVDDQARADFLNQSGSTGGFFNFTRVSAGQLTAQLERNITLTAVNLDAIPELNTRFNEFLYALQNVDQQPVASARNYSQSYTSVFGKQVPPSYIDLGHFVQLAAEQTGDGNLNRLAGAVMEALNNSIVAERHGQSKPGSTGMAVYFPNSTLYRSPYTGLQSYTQIAGRFAQTSLWDDFLGFHYSDRPFEPDSSEAVVPPAGAAVRAPGGGDISLSAIETSSTTVSPGDSITLSVEISGSNVGYVYFFTGYYDPNSNSIFVADTDYLESAETRSFNGVYYPVWPDSDSFIMDFEWEPTLFAITDGSQSVVALFNPAAYGATAEEAVYVVDGFYTIAETGEQRPAEMHFKDGRLFQVFAFNGSDQAGAPAEIYPAQGDTFTLSQKWLELDENGNVTETV